eukprot:CAMPEP_0198703730 /NCGR_PEP_ID=MMETSP1468-20131203/389500_1 /TAXON_ID=1461545 /ORGANISM="Mantoniella sp, Strain CCMP1436" /LENGTH=54 /DNA_ID=CAMNT_0044462471 /DNA_START=200 /DNA_END=364 /DNA_ORIENTATION=+
MPYAPSPAFSGNGGRGRHADSSTFIIIPDPNTASGSSSSPWDVGFRVWGSGLRV